MADTLVDVAIHRPVGHVPRAVGEVVRSPGQNSQRTGRPGRPRPDTTSAKEGSRDAPTPRVLTITTLEASPFRGPSLPCDPLKDYAAAGTAKALRRSAGGYIKKTVRENCVELTEKREGRWLSALAACV